LKLYFGDVKEKSNLLLEFNLRSQLFRH